MTLHAYGSCQCRWCRCRCCVGISLERPMHDELDRAFDRVEVRIIKIVAHDVSVGTTAGKAKDFPASTSVLVELQRGVFKGDVILSATFIVLEGASSFGEGIECAFELHERKSIGYF